MKNKLISTENITLLIIVLIGILVALLVYNNGPNVNPKIALDNSIHTDQTQNVINESTESNETTSAEKSEETVVNKTSEIKKESSNILPPKFDLFSVDEAGSATIAGKGLAGQTLEIIVDGEVISNVIPDKNGDFATILDIGISDNPRSLTLKTKHSDGREVISDETVLITPILKGSDKPQEQALDVKDDDQHSTEKSEVKTTSSDQSKTEKPTLSNEEENSEVSIAIVSSKEVKVITPIQQRNAPKVTDVIIDAISYDEQGEVLLAGRGVEDQHIRIYVDNKPIKTSEIKADGTWSLDLEEIDAGVYILRIDQLDADGLVTSRTETPFQKETAEVAKKMASLQSSSEDGGSPRIGAGLSTVIIQPGYTLWAVARRTYGLGMQYVRIYHANKDQILDPDLIYPGQIFKLPE